MIKIKNFLIILLSASIVASTFTGCGKSGKSESASSSGTTADKSVSANKDSVFSLNYSSLNSFNPYTCTNDNNLLICQLLYDNFFEVGSDFTASSYMASTYSHSDDGLTWTFTVNQSVPCHDGTTLTAYDVAYSIKLAMSSDLYSARLSCIDSVSASGEAEFTVTLKRINNQLPVLLAIPVIKDATGTSSAPTGTGPYAYNSDGKCLNRFESYSNSANLPIDTIYLQEFTGRNELLSAFSSATIDLMINDPIDATVQYSGAYDSVYYNTTRLQYIGLNTNGYFLSNASYRYAFNFVVDRENIVSQYMSGCASVAVLPISPSSKLFSSTYTSKLSYSLSKCLSALEEASVKDVDSDGKLEYSVGASSAEINLTFIVYSGSKSKVSAAQKITDDLNSIGFNVTLRQLDWTEYTEALSKGNFDLYYGEVKLSPDFDLTELITPSGSLNYGGSSDTTYTTLINDYLAASDDNRQENADKMLQYISEKAVIVPVCFEKNEVISSSGLINGMSPTQYNVFHNISSWKISFGS